MNQSKTPNFVPINELVYGIDTQKDRLKVTLENCLVTDRVLDVGTGRGAYVRTLLSKGIDATGVDQTCYDEWGTLNGVAFHVANAKQLPFDDKQFDITLCFEVLEHCQDPRATLAEIARCTKNKLILSVPDCNLDNTLRRYDLAMAHWTDPTHCNFFDKYTIEELLVGAGFKIISRQGCYKIYPANYFWNSIRAPLPSVFRNIAIRISNRLKLFEEYWSSILIVAEVSR